MKLLILLIVAALLSLSAFVSAEDAYFAFKTNNDREFIFKLTNDERIKHARKILSGDEKNEVHVMGRIKKSRKDYNPHFEYHLDPDTIMFFEVAIEVCDATTEYVNDHLDEVCGAFLPGCYFCPWTSKLTKEIKK